MKRRQRKSRDHRKSTSHITGLWRDRNFLVIDLCEHKFPCRCLKSNLPCDLPAKPVLLSALRVSQSEAECLEDDERLAEIVRVSYGRKWPTGVDIRLRLPLGPSWHKIVTWPWGTRIAAAGGVGIVISFLALLLSARVPEWPPAPVWGRLLLVSLAIAFLGVSIQMWLSGFLPVRRIEEKKIWLGGVHPDWLRPLPEFVPSPQMLIRELEEANWKFWMAPILGFFFVMLAFAAMSSLQPGLVGRWVVNFYLVGIAVAIFSGNFTSGQILRTRRRLDELYLSRVRRRGRKRS